MYKLYTDKTEIFECKVKIDGASLSNSQARLVIESEDLNLLFKGRIDGGIFFVTGSNLTGINDTGIIFGFDNITKLGILVKEQG